MDFGVAGLCAGVNTDKSEAGSLKYMSPELLSGKVKMVHPSQDVWAMGCILYGMLFGDLPFKGKNNKEIIVSVVNGGVNIPTNIKISPEAKDLLLCLLKTDPKDRITMNEILDHPWITGQKL